jgi:thiol:disulfide interchange protein DsbA
MKKIIIFMTMLMLPLMACSSDYQEGKHYTKFSEESSRKAEVREYFSFYCPHCFGAEPLMAELKKSLPEGTSFEMNHVDFLRQASVKVQGLLSRAIVVAQQLKREKELVGEIFKYIHVEKRTFTSQNDIRKVFVANGVDGVKFDKLMKSFTVSSKAKLMKKKQDALAKEGVLRSVPSVVVNGQFLIHTKELDRSNTTEDYKKLVKHLLTLK